MICCLSFINGIGYTPESKYWRFITNPIFTITVLLLLLYGMFR
jgi:predicted membrane protein